MTTIPPTDDPINTLRQTVKYPTMRLLELLTIFEQRHKVSKVKPNGLRLFFFHKILRPNTCDGRYGRAVVAASSKQEAIDIIVKQVEELRYSNQLKQEFFEELTKSFKEELEQNNNGKTVWDVSHAIGVDYAFDIWKIFPHSDSSLGYWEGTIMDLRSELIKSQVEEISLKHGGFCLIEGGITD